MKKPFMQLAKDGTHEIIVEGVISGELWWGDEFTPEMVRAELAELNGQPIRVIINSPGGEVFAGAAIYNALREYDGRKTVRIDGIAASMASVIAMVGDEIIMNPGSTMMVHRPMVGAYGNVTELHKAIEMLEAIEETILPIYEKRTGLSKDEVFDLLDKETWMSADKAIELGFADKAQEEEPVASAFDKVKAMLGNEQFAFSMSAVHKSLSAYVDTAPKGETKVETEETKAEDVITEVETVEEVKTVEETAPVEETETEVEAVAETEETVEEVTTPKAETKEVVKEIKMTKTTAAEMVVPVAKVEEATAKSDAVSHADYKRSFVNMLSAAYNGEKEVASAKAEELKAQMVINGTTGSELLGGEVLARDIRQAYELTGRVGSLVNRIDIEGAETFKQLVESAGAGFRPVALGGTKQEDQPVWTPVTFEPKEWALIVAWLDGVQKRSPIAIYDQIVRYIAREYAKLEDRIVLTYAGGTVGGETFAATGLVPALETAGRVTPVASYTSEDILPAIGSAYGSIESDEGIVMVANRSTWGALATAIDANGLAVFTTVGEQVAAGALGTFRVVLSNELEDGQVVVGNFNDYTIVTRGGLSTLFSREATVGSLNLFTNDASALRADVDITGGAVLLTSFQLLEFPSAS